MHYVSSQPQLFWVSVYAAELNHRDKHAAHTCGYRQHFSLRTALGTAFLSPGPQRGPGIPLVPEEVCGGRGVGAQEAALTSRGVHSTPSGSDSMSPDWVRLSLTSVPPQGTSSPTFPTLLAVEKSVSNLVQHLLTCSSRRAMGVLTG